MRVRPPLYLSLLSSFLSCFFPPHGSHRRFVCARRDATHAARPTKDMTLDVAVRLLHLTTYSPLAPFSNPNNYSTPVPSNDMCDRRRIV